MWVCPACIEDEGLKGVVIENTSRTRCDYCQTPEDYPYVCSLDSIIEYMRGHLDQDFCDPASLQHKKDDARTTNVKEFCVFELFRRIEFRIKNESLFEEIASHFSNHMWVERRDFEPSNSEEYLNDWLDYCEAVAKIPSNDDNRAAPYKTIDYGKADPRVARTLERICGIVCFSVGQYHNSKYWRIRIMGKNKHPQIPDDFTSPPARFAIRPNRMSPAGVPMFYGASNVETAYRETVEVGKLGGKAVWAAQFQTKIPLNLLDLTEGYMRPSYFLPHGPAGLHYSWFLERLQPELSKSIARDGNEHAEYRPTQVFAEYVRYHLKSPGGEPIHGIIFKSSQCTGNSCVIFADQSQCVDDISDRDAPQLLQLIESTCQELGQPPEDGESWN